MKSDGGTRSVEAEGQASAVEQVKRGVLETDDRLGDVQRARMAASLAERLAALDAQNRASPPLPRGRRASAVLRGAGFVAAAAAAAAVVVMLMPRSQRGAGDAVVHSGSPALPVSAGTRGAEPAGVPKPASSPSAADSSDHIEVPAGARVRARLGERARTTLVGPAAIDVVTSTAEEIEVRLTAGTLLADYDARKGGVLRIRTPTLVVEVTGTLFAVTVGKAGTTVSVAHGRVRVTPDGATRSVSVGTAQTLVAGTTIPRPLGASVRGQLARHEREGMGRAAARAVSIPPRPRTAEAADVRATAPAGRGPGRAMVAMGPPSDKGVPVVVSPPSPPPQPVAPVSSPPSPAPLPPPPAAQPAPAAPRPAVAAIPTAAQRYRQAEEAMQRHDRARARLELGRVVTEFPRDRLADLARYELAQLALADGDRVTAAREFGLVASEGRVLSLRRTAAFARCRLELGPHVPMEQEGAGVRCLSRFRAEFPEAPEDAEVLALLIAHESRRGRCRAVTRLAGEYARAYPTGAFAAEAERRARACGTAGGSP